MCWLGRYIGNLIRALRSSEATDSDPCIRTERTFAAQVFDIRVRSAVGRCANAKEFAIVEPEIAELGSTDSNGILQHRLKHRLQFSW
jgi:hypothetical protein